MTAALAAPSPGVPQPPRGIRRLKITKVRVVEVRGIPTGKGLVMGFNMSKTEESRDYVVAQFFTDQGLIGTTMDGEFSGGVAATAPGGIFQLPAGIGKEIQEIAESYFVGKDPFEIEVHAREFFAQRKARMRLYFLEVALWDIIGKSLGEPLYRIWGASSTKVATYAATLHFLKTPQQRAEDALRFHELGFRAIKLRFHKVDPLDDIALVREVIKAAGSRMTIMVDANQSHKKMGDSPPVWDYDRAVRMARELEDLGVYWLEEPLHRSAFDDLARVRRQLTRMHLAGGEGNVGFEDFRQFVAKGSYSYIQPDPMIAGPLSVVRKIAAMAEAFGVLFGAHHGKSGVGMMANLHMQCAAPNSGYLEYPFDPGYWNPEGFQAGFAAPYPIDKSGYMHAPSGPGLGIEWDRTFFAKYGLQF